MKIPKLNRALLRKVKKHILEEPRRLDMTDFAAKVDNKTSPCGTQACIAGWTVLLTKKPGVWNRTIRRHCNWEEGKDSFWFRKATKLLGLTHDEALAMFLRWKPGKGRGRSGAKGVARKIDTILKNREDFDNQYVQNDEDGY